MSQTLEALRRLERRERAKRSERESRADVETQRPEAAALQPEATLELVQERVVQTQCAATATAIEPQAAVELAEVEPSAAIVKVEPVKPKAVKLEPVAIAPTWAEPAATVARIEASAPVTNVNQAVVTPAQPKTATKFDLRVFPTSADVFAETREALNPRSMRWPSQTSVPDASYENLAVRLLAQRAANRPATVMFTSPCDGDGKTGLLISLAPILAARAQRPVLLVDADFRKGDLGERLAAASGGLTGPRLGRCGIGEAACPTSVPNLSFLPLDLRPVADDDRFDFSEAAEARGQSRQDGPSPFSHKTAQHWSPSCDDLSTFDAVLDGLKCRFPLVLLDSPSLAHPGVARMGSYCDGVCLVVRAGHTPYRAVHDAANVIEAAGGRRWGCIVIGG